MKNQTNKYALFVLKPDAIRDFLDVKMTQNLEDLGLNIVKRKFITFTPDQAARVYAEKEDFNYFPQLISFMSSAPSLCVILRCDNGNDAVKEAKTYRDWARNNLKMQNFELTSNDLALLNENQHPRQIEITRVMALENLIHVSDDFCAQTPLLGEVFSQWDLVEIRAREPELYKILSQAKRESEINGEITLYDRSNERI